MKDQQDNKKTTFVLLFTIFIDGLGIGIIFPILTPLILHSHFSFFGPNISSSYRATILTLIFSAYPIGMFFGAPLLGTLSDKIGRKKTLLVSVGGDIIGFFILSLGIGLFSIPIILISRLISGITAGSMPVAQAAIVDMSKTEKQRSVYLGYISLSYGLGFTFGPLLGSFAGNEKYLILLITPLLLAAIICLVNFTLLFYVFNDTSKTNPSVKINAVTGINNLMYALKSKSLSGLFIVLFILLFGQFTFYQYLPIYLNENFQDNSLIIGLVLGFYAFNFSIGLVYFLPKLLKLISIRKLAYFSLITLSAAVAIFSIDKSIAEMLIPLFFIPICLGFAYVSLITSLSLNAKSNEQGQIMGTASALTSLAWAASPFLIKFSLSHASINLVYFCSIIFFLGVIILMLRRIITQQEK